MRPRTLLRLVVCSLVILTVLTLWLFAALEHEVKSCERAGGVMNRQIWTCFDKKAQIPY